MLSLLRNLRSPVVTCLVNAVTVEVESTAKADGALYGLPTYRDSGAKNPLKPQSMRFMAPIRALREH
jgi:hypothetical protein